MLTGRAAALRRAAPGGRAVAATRARPSPSTTSSRTPTPPPRCRYADGLAKAYAIRGEDRHVVAVIGDGALTGGMAWEALNNIAIAKDSRLVIVVNDNGRSYTPTVGGLATALTALRTNPRYEQVLDQVKRRLNAVRGVGPAAYDALHADQEGHEGRPRPAGALRGPRPEVRRPGRRPRPRGPGAGARAGQAVQRPGDRARADPQGLRLRRRRAARGRPVPQPRARSTSRPARRRPRAGSGPTSSPTRWSTSASAAATSSRSPPR